LSQIGTSFVSSPDGAKLGAGSEVLLDGALKQGKQGVFSGGKSLLANVTLSYARWGCRLLQMELMRSDDAQGLPGGRISIITR
jgi:hypothetical protein